MTEKLTAREVEILTWVTIGKTDWEIAAILDLSRKTVNFHVEKVKRRLGCSSRIAMIAAALRDGLIPFPGPSSLTKAQQTGRGLGAPPTSVRIAPCDQPA